MYETMTFESILGEMFKLIPNNMDRREGSIIYDATAPCAYSIADMYFKLDNHLNLVFVDTAAGEYLDRLAISYGLKRKEAMRTVRTGMFNTKLPDNSRFSTTGEAALVFTAGEIVSKEGGYIYRLICETPGKEGNDVSGELLPVEYVNGLTTAELGEVIIPGTEEETDDALRDRLLKKIQQPAAGGNVNDYYNWAMKCAGVGAVKVFPLADGPGTVKVVLADEHGRSVESGTAKKVAEYIEGQRPIGADVTVVPATEKQVNVTARIKLAAGYNLGYVQDVYLFSVDGYLRQRAFGLDYVSLARLGNLLLAVDGVEDYSGLIINGATENLAVLPGEIAVAGTIRLEVG